MKALIDEYTLPEETIYLKANSYKPPYFAPGELAKIVNYEKASKDGYSHWFLHHRLELNPDGSTYKSRNTLIKEGLYYRRPATELIFLTDSEHSALHAKQINANREPPGKITRDKMRDAKLKSNDTERRYRCVLDAIERGVVLCFRDYAFYRRYCLRNGVEFKSCQVDKTLKKSTLDFKKPVKDPEEKPTRFLRQIRRYRNLRKRISEGGRISKNDAKFLRRCMTRYKWYLPVFQVDWKA